MFVLVALFRPEFLGCSRLIAWFGSSETSVENWEIGDEINSKPARTVIFFFFFLVGKRKQYMYKTYDENSQSIFIGRHVNAPRL